MMNNAKLSPPATGAKNAAAAARPDGAANVLGTSSGMNSVPDRTHMSLKYCKIRNEND
jgi:hypothetical protein